MWERVSENEQMIPGVVYRHTVQTQYLPDWLLDPVARAILELEATFQGVKLVNYSVQRGVVQYSFMIPKAQAALIAPIIIAAVIGGILVLLSLFIINSIVEKLVTTAGGMAIIIAVILGLGIVGYFLVKSPRARGLAYEYAELPAKAVRRYAPR